MKDEDDKLWDLLGQAKRTDVSPFFSRNVLRAVRLAQQERAGLLSWLRRGWRIAVPVAAAALVMVLSLSVLPRPPRAQPLHDPLAEQIVSNPDYDVINHLDELVASEENALWLEPSID